MVLVVVKIVLLKRDMEDVQLLYYKKFISGGLA